MKRFLVLAAVGCGLLAGCAKPLDPRASGDAAILTPGSLSWPDREEHEMRRKRAGVVGLWTVSLADSVLPGMEGASAEDLAQREAAFAAQGGITLDLGADDRFEMVLLQDRFAGDYERASAGGSVELKIDTISGRPLTELEAELRTQLASAGMTGAEADATIEQELGPLRDPWSAEIEGEGADMRLKVAVPSSQGAVLGFRKEEE